MRELSGLCLSALAVACTSAPPPSAAPPGAGLLARIGERIEQDPGQQDPSTRQPPATPARQDEPEAWKPPEPNPAQHDWIELKSEEWLRGKLTVFREGSLEFESQKMNAQTFGWGDVKTLRSARQHTVVLANRETYVGTVLMRDGTLVVATDEGEHRFDRSRIIAIVPRGTKGESNWNGKLSLSLGTQSGNTNQVTANARAGLTRRTAFSRLDLDYIANYAKLSGVETLDNQRVTGEWNLYLDDRWFVTPASIGAYRDPFQNIELQLTPSAGVGHHVVKQSTLEWDVTLAGGWRYTQSSSVAAGEPSSDSTAAVLLGTVFDWDMTKHVDLEVKYSVQIGVPDTTDTNHFLVTTLSVDLVADLDLNVTFQWNRIGNPTPDSLGNVPLADDYWTTFGIGWTF